MGPANIARFLIDLPLVKWGIQHEDGKFEDERYEAAVWASRGPQGSTPRQSATSDVAASRVNEEMRKPGGKEGKSVREKEGRERHDCANGAGPEPRGLSLRKGAADDEAAALDQGMRKPGREGQND